MKTIKLKSGARVTIEILKKSVAEESVSPQFEMSQSRKGLIPQKEEEEFLARRAVKAVERGIKIIDLGFLLGSPKFDLPLSVIPSLGSVLTAEPSQADYEARDSFIFTYGEPADYDSIFAPITPDTVNNYKMFVDNSSGYNPQIMNDFEGWEDDNVIILPEEAFNGDTFYIYTDATRDARPFNYFNLKGTNRNRATKSYASAGEDEGGVNLAKPFTVYWLPNLLRSMSTLGWYPSTGVSRFHALNLFFAVMPRAVFLEPDDPQYGYHFNRRWDRADDLTTYSNAWEAFLLEYNLPNARAFIVDGFTYTALPTAADYLPSGGIFPIPPSVPDSTPGGVEGSAIQFYGLRLNTSTLPDVMLLAIIKQGDDYFYIWSDLL